MPTRTKLPQYRREDDAPSQAEVEIADPPAEAGRLLKAVLKGEVSLGALIDLSAQDLERLVELGKGHLKAGKVAEARRLFEGITALEPQVAAGHLLLGMACDACDDDTAALSAFTQAILLMAEQSDEGLCGAYLGRGTVRLRSGDMAGAMTDFTLAHQHDPGHDALVSQTVETMRQQCAEQLSAELEEAR